jgi:hypothetical protein
MIDSQSLQAEGLNHRSRGQRPRNAIARVPSRPVRALHLSLRLRASEKKVGIAKRTQFSFKTYCPSTTNNEKISLLIKSKSYRSVNSGFRARLRLLKASKACLRLLKPKLTIIFFILGRMNRIFDSVYSVPSVKNELFGSLRPAHRSLAAKVGRLQQDPQARSALFHWPNSHPHQPVIQN